MNKPKQPEDTSQILAKIPGDAPFIGDHVLYRWDAKRQAFVGYDPPEDPPEERL